ncbi:iron ABC transporter permease [Aliiglaciecola sp. CAU 1673]|uniref:ABC transporter permease n=1 Tax=Aliiglaciecola sp. CAU 1673 TaxID=3032595 RepID=UPI0023DAF04B|nr:iron ABC transporter permease [Aliiglaciecola sp. CAU 1673]MDF2177164.1 iron ABC transporter permease [Aliiglaciecola sp. CAU 1673]
MLTIGPALVLALPVLVVLLSLLQPQWQVWQHLAETVLSDYVKNSLILAFGVGAGTLVLGTCLAWCCHHYEFWGRRPLQWLLLLPLAMPAYIIAYSYTGLLDFAGPLQTALREVFGWGYGDYWFPEIRSLHGAILMLVLVLYPYVFMLAKTAFREQSQSLLEVSRVAGLSPFAHFVKVAVPLARPAILTGTALAMMEALADYGTVQYFGISTFTTGIFRTWFGLGNGLAAAQLSALLCSFVLLLLLLERWSRRKVRYFHLGGQHQVKRVPASGFKALWLWLFCALPVTLGFLLPVCMLIHWAWLTAEGHWNSRFLALAWNSFSLAALAALVILLVALIFAYARRLSASRWVHAPVTLVAMGYAIPGTVIAVGTMVPLVWFDKTLDALMQSWLGISTGLLLSGTVFALILAYAVRFLAVALHQVEAGLERIKPSMDQAGRTLGLSPQGVLTRIHLPLLTPSLLGALLLVFVDVLKELPATLILRPFNFDTLAIRAYEMASDERLADAALPALTILLVGIFPVIILSRAIEKATSMETADA